MFPFLRLSQSCCASLAVSPPTPSRGRRVQSEALFSLVTCPSPLHYFCLSHFHLPAETPLIIQESAQARTHTPLQLALLR